MNKQRLAAYAAFYKKHITEEIMPFWDSRCIDRDCGGYLTCFDREGNLTDDRKYIWFQGRQLYTYALLCNHMERRQEWLDYAAHGFRFLADYAYAGNGRWNYLLDRKGGVITGTTSLFADMHVLQGLGEYAHALNGTNAELMAIVRESYDALERNMFDPYFKDIYENTWQENHLWHDMYMTCLSAVMPCIPVLGRERTDRLLAECLDKICNWFARDDYHLVFETVSWENQVFLDTPQGRFANPGHMSEAAWFMLEYARTTGDAALKKRAMEIGGWVYDSGYDKARGGLNSYIDVTGAEPVASDWFLATNSLWDDKVWWANAEALCMFIKSYEAGDDAALDRFERQHDYCQKHFFDPQYGEWYERLHGDGTVKVADKGTEWKCAFHLVRALVYTMEALQRLAGE